MSYDMTLVFEDYPSTKAAHEAAAKAVNVAKVNWANGLEAVTTNTGVNIRFQTATVVRRS